ncbi:recombinase family protein [Brevibacillus laterosporus]|uniref:recombinase family protein n=1 Tax=Brevibacillus laterosporus TaxID=1465 RepID=UPI003D1A623C
MKVGIYRRISTEMQHEDGCSLQIQSEQLGSFIKEQGWTIVEDYADDGYSAENMDRPALNKLIEDIKQQKIDVVLVYRLDRLVRSASDLNDLLEIMDKHNVKFKSYKESVDTMSNAGKMHLTLLAAAALSEN